MTLAEWKEYAITWVRLTRPSDPLIPCIRRARTWASLETAIPWQLAAALANRCKNTDL